MEKNYKSLNDDDEGKNFCWSLFSCSSFPQLCLACFCLTHPCPACPHPARLCPAPFTLAPFPLAPLALLNWAWRLWGPGSPSSLEALQAWPPFGHGGPVGLEDLPCYLFVWIRKLFQLFLLIFFFLYHIFFKKFIPAKPTAL